MEEIWKDIPNYEGIYQASSLGQIRTAPNKTTFTKLHGVRRWKTRILKGRGDNRITGKRVSLWKDGKEQDWLVARLVAITFLGFPDKNSNTVNHINGNRLDNRIENADNLRHAFNTGLMPTCKKIKLYNKDVSMDFRSMSVASMYIGRNAGYIGLCIKRNRKIIGKNGTEYNFELL